MRTLFAFIQSDLFPSKKVLCVVDLSKTNPDRVSQTIQIFATFQALWRKNSDLNEVTGTLNLLGRFIHRTLI